MTGYYTLTIVKPHAVVDNSIGGILSMINKAGFRISAIKMTMLSNNQAGEFYKEHNGKDFYCKLVEMMSSGPIVVAILEKENAISDLRLLIGNTDPAKAEEGTVRKKFGKSMRENAIHASDGIENAIRECNFFFSDTERF